jgi:hypothetical protein
MWGHSIAMNSSVMPATKIGSIIQELDEHVCLLLQQLAVVKHTSFYRLRSHVPPASRMVSQNLDRLFMDLRFTAISWISLLKDDLHDWTP